MSSVQAISLVFFTDTWRPDSFYERIASNRKQGLHTLCLLDIKVKEPSLESLARGKPVYEPARCGQCAKISFFDIALHTMLLLGNWPVALLTYLASVARSGSHQAACKSFLLFRSLPAQVHEREHSHRAAAGD